MKRLLPITIALSLLLVFPRLDAQRPLFTEGTPPELTLARQMGLERVRTVASEKGIDGPADLVVSGAHIDSRRIAHTRVQQYFRGIPVFGGEAIAHLGPNGERLGETDDLLVGINVELSPRLTPAAAIDVAARDYGCSDCLTAAPSATLMILRDAGVDRLVYRVSLTRIDGTNDTALPVRFVDAHGGFVALAYDNLQTGTGSSLYSGTVTIGTSLMSSGQYAMENLVRRVGTMNWQNSTFNLVRFQDLDDIWQDSAQRAGVDAQYGAEKFLDYLQSVHGRNGIDGSGGPRAFNAHDGAGMITSTVHYSVSYNNAFWNGSYMTYGDGDGFSFTPLVTLDIAGHEMMHGVTQYSAGLIYQGESGALNESWSDVFGALNERHARGENANTWLLGEEAYTPATSGDALRYLTNPHQASNKGYTADDDPDHYSERYTGPFDNGGVHINSGIANKAFYLLAQGGSHHLGGSMTGIGTEAAARIWYSGLVSYMTSNTNFAGARDATLLAAAAIHGSGSPQQQAVSLAWCLVGVGTCPTVQAISVTPNSGMGVTQSFTLQYSDTNGASNLISARVRFGATNVGPGTCTARYNAATGAVGILDGTTWSDTGVIGSGTLSNSQCTLNLASSSVTPSGTNLTVVLNITFSPSFTGLKQIYMLALSGGGANSGWQQRGTWTPSVGGPAAISVTPNTGTGTTQSFTLQYSDTSGAANLNSARVRVGASNVGPGTCTARYNATTGAVGILDDLGVTWTDTGTMGSGSLANGQCTLNLATSSVSVNGNNLTVVLNITFKPAFNGQKQIYMLATNTGGGNTGWLQRGTWTVPSGGQAVLQAVSVTPDSGSGGSQAFMLAYSDSLGVTADLASARVRIGATNVGPGTCSVDYNSMTHQARIMDDAGVWQGWVAFGVGMLSNSQCAVNLSTSIAFRDGQNLFLTLQITFSGTFAGPKQIWMLGQSTTGPNTGWIQRGSWTVTAPPPAQVQAISVTPNSGSGTVQGFVLAYSDSLGVTADLASARLRIGATNVAAGTCSADYNAMSDRIRIMDDAGMWGGWSAFGAGSLANSQCSINLATSTAVRNGTDLTLTLQITFSGTFTGAKQLWMLAQSNSGTNTGWIQRGTWTVTTLSSTVLFLDSQPGDFIGEGIQRTITTADAAFTFSTNGQGGIAISVKGASLLWGINFSLPNAVPMMVGSYGAAFRFPTGGPSPASFIGMSVFGDGRGCNVLTGRFNVLEIVRDGSGVIQRFAADIEQHCEDADPALFGAIRYNSTIASSVPFGGVYPSYKLRIAKPTVGRVSGNGIDCSSSTDVCEVSFGSPTDVQLTATPDAGRMFGGWTGKCHGAQTIVLNVNTEANCSAVFITEVPAISRTLLFWNSQEGDFIGEGRREVFAGFSRLTGGVMDVTNNGVIMNLVSVGDTSMPFWVLRFQAPNGQALAPGSYESVARFPTATEGAIDVAGNGRGCNATAGRFVVHEFVTVSGFLSRLALDFEQHCEGQMAPPRPLIGSLRYNSLVPHTSSLAVTFDGEGQVTLSPSGTICTDKCTETMAMGAAVQLTAQPDSGWEFVGWDGDTDCEDGSLTMSAPTSCRAVFQQTGLTVAPALLDRR